MTELLTKDVVRTIVYSYDLSTLGIPVSLPEPYKNIQVTDAEFSEHMPDLTERAQVIAMESCYMLFRTKNEGATLDQFQTTLTNAEFQRVVEHVLPKLTPEIPAAALREHHRVKFLNLTRVDVNRQVRFDK